MKRTRLCFIAAAAALAACGGEEEEVSTYLLPSNVMLDAVTQKVAAYRLELRVDADGNETPYVVGCDGVRRPVVLLSPGEYNAMQDKIENIYKALHTTPAGRVALHGKVVTHEVDSHNRQTVDVHEDGYRHANPMQATGTSSKGARPREKVRLSPLPPRLNTRGESRREMSARHRKMREELRAAIGRPAKEVTVEHDATTGKDTVKK